LWFGCKKSGEYDGDFLTYENSFVWNAVLSAYTGSPSFNTVEIDSLLGHDLSGNVQDDIASVSTMGEFSWSSDGGTTWTSTKQFTVTLEHDVIHGSEGVPTEGNPTYPSPENIALKNSNNHFSATQTINGTVSACCVSLITNYTTPYAIKQVGNYSIAITDASTIANVENASGNQELILIGPAAGYGVDTATRSIMIGSNTGNFSASATNSIFMGYGAGYESPATSESVFIGTSTGTNSPSASNSVFVGQNAGLNAAGASNSVFIGKEAGYGSAGSEESIYIGRLAGKSLTGPRNIIIGSSEEYYNNETFTNALVIGHQAYADQDGQIVLGSTQYPYLTAGTGEVAASPTKFLRVKVNGVNYNIPLHASA
jgi:hypothetical protein